MAKKPAGLGRGLGDLLEDNTPEIQTNKSTVVINNDGKPIRITPKGSAPIEPKALYEQKHKNRSVKANFKK